MALIFTISSITHKKIGFSLLGNLIFCFLLLGCKHGDEKSGDAVYIEWKDDKAIGFVIPESIANAERSDSTADGLSIRLAGNTIQVLGNYSNSEEGIVFRPLIPFSRGLQYEIWSGKKLISRIDIPNKEGKQDPLVTAVYPTGDTLPENLLKIHIRFSAPMQEGEALKNISLVRNGKDTVPSVFLDLQPELWNSEKTTLTLWLDPGRIKRDLQPNQKMGAPLHTGEAYELIIANDWQSAEAIALGDTYRKKFRVGIRDGHSPDPSQWIIRSPVVKTDNPLLLSFNESLDLVLLEKTIHVTGDDGRVIDGRVIMGEKERFLLFYPPVAWEPGQYTVEIESRLEDLAGNNLERLFDNDLGQAKKITGQKVFKRTFLVE